MNIDNYQNQLGIVNEWIRSADQKISILTAVTLGAIGLLGNAIISSFMQPNIVGDLIISIIFSAWSTTLGWSLFKLVIALSPSTKNDKGSFLYFGHIARMDPEDFAKGINKLNKSDYKQALIEQIYTNSVIATQKHRLLGESVKILLANTVLLLLLIIFIGVR